MRQKSWTAWKHRSGEDLRKNSAALKVPQSSVASIILEHAEESGGRGSAQRCNHEASDGSERAPEILRADGRTSQKVSRHRGSSSCPEWKDGYEHPA